MGSWYECMVVLVAAGWEARVCSAALVAVCVVGYVLLCCMQRSHTLGRGVLVFESTTCMQSLGGLLWALLPTAAVFHKHLKCDRTAEPLRFMGGTMGHLQLPAGQCTLCITRYVLPVARRGSTSIKLFVLPCIEGRAESCQCSRALLYTRELLCGPAHPTCFLMQACLNEAGPQVGPCQCPRAFLMHACISLCWEGFFLNMRCTQLLLA
jgi:hypothetical protein